jgi:hypothetical protein
MQDFFSHYGQGYRYPSWGFGHGVDSFYQAVLDALGLDSFPPDDPLVYLDAYQAAAKRTQDWLTVWTCHCARSPDGTWKPKCPTPTDCSLPNNPYGSKAPPPNRPRPGETIWDQIIDLIQGGMPDELYGAGPRIGW